jgi:RNA polymerase sigma-70 factor (ECF subfamily)
VAAIEPAAALDDAAEMISDSVTRTLVLLDRAKRGDERALGRIFERYYERVRRIVRIRLGPRLRGEVEVNDILQDTFCVAVKRIQDFQPRDEASLINWLSKLAEHQITDAAAHFNAKKRDSRRKVSLYQQQSAEDSSAGLAADPPDAAPSPAELVAKSEEAVMVEECIHTLPEQYRELILMRDYMGCTWAEIAEKAQRPSEEAARMMHARAIVELTKLMKQRTQGQAAR